MNDLRPLLERGVRHHSAGQLDEAEPMYRQVLAVDPQNLNALHLLGALSHQRGRHDEAVSLISQAIALDGSRGELHANLAAALLALARLPEAQTALETALRLDPSRGDLHRALGRVLQSLGQTEPAIDRMRTAITAAPQDAESYVALGTVLRDAGRTDEAIACFRELLDIAPQSAEAHSCLGVLYFDLGRLDEAIQSLREALRIDPQMATAHSALGVIEKQQGRYDEAAAEFREAIRLQPDFAAAHNNLGTVLKAQGQVREAVDCFSESLRLEISAAGLAPLTTDGGPAPIESVLAAFDQAADGEAAQAIKRTVALRRHNRAMALLLLGDLEAGWPEYEWRLHEMDVPPWSWKLPGWDGSPLDGRSLLVYCEQGRGDNLQFIRYLPLLPKSGGKVLLGCPASLCKILGSCAGIDQVCPLEQPLPWFDAFVPMLSLPRVMRTRLDTIPAHTPYLSVDADRVARWGRILADRPGVRVGISWQGSKYFAGDRDRSLPLAAMASLARVSGVRLISLQKGLGREQIAEVDFEVEDFDHLLDEDGQAFVDTAAMIENLDLVVSSDTAVLHLAGALAARAWGALSRVPDWRWLLARDDSPWYPTMRLFRQQRLGDWQELFERMAIELAQHSPHWR